MIRIVVDSGTDQNDWMREQYDYEFIPASVMMNGKDYLDEIETTSSEVYAYMKEGHFPKTSQMSPGNAKKVFEKCRKQGDEVIYISLFKKVSGTYQVGYNLVQEYKEKYPEFNIEIVDSLAGGGGTSILVLQALEMVKEGYSFGEIVQQIKWNAQYIGSLFTVDDMSWLAKGGRIPKAVGRIGSLLNVKPYLTIGQEGIEKKGLIRGKDRVYTRMIKDVKEGVKEFTDQFIAISHVGHENNAKLIQEKVQEEFPKIQTQIFEIGAALSAHFGIGAIGVFYMTKQPEINVTIGANNY